MTPLHRFYQRLLEAYGPQGWWPLLGHPGVNPTKSGSGAGYHPGDYDFPRTDDERFEICTGAILTQNTAWPNVEQALRALAAAGALSPGAILALPAADLASLIRPSGYHNTKARKLQELATFFQALQGRVPGRQELLAVWGIGPETADSIRLYAYGQLEAVVDAYTRRCFAGLGQAPGASSYEAMKAYCVANLPATVVVYQEFHALVVEHAKRMKRSKALDWTRPVPLWTGLPGSLR
jgi:endonuclease III related protein